jgi:hypothetical protein
VLTNRYPLKVTKSMGKKKVSRRSKVKPFIKVVNYAHLLPTRYVLELDSLKGSISNDTFKEPSQREDAKKAIKKAFEERYAKGSNRWCRFGFATERESLLTCSLLQAKVLSYWRGIGGLDTVGDDVHFGSTTLRVWIIARPVSVVAYWCCLTISEMVFALPDVCWLHFCLFATRAHVRGL